MSYGIWWRDGRRVRSGPQNCRVEIRYCVDFDCNAFEVRPAVDDVGTAACWCGQPLRCAHHDDLRESGTEQRGKVATDSASLAIEHADPVLVARLVAALEASHYPSLCRSTGRRSAGIPCEQCDALDAAALAVHPSQEGDA